jgi:RNA polymerase sigma factor (sigma-70 family)
VKSTFLAAKWREQDVQMADGSGHEAQMTGGGDKTLRARLTPQQQENLKYAYGRALAYACGELHLSKWDAEDVVQAAALRAIESMSAYEDRPGVPFVAWLKKILLNLVRDEARHRERVRLLQGHVADAMAPVPAVGSDLQLANARARGRRDQVLASLTPGGRAILEVCVHQDAGRIDRVEAAARLGCTKADFDAAKKRLAREIEHVMERLGFSPDDLVSELPLVASAGSGRDRGEDGDR